MRKNDADNFIFMLPILRKWRYQLLLFSLTTVLISAGILLSLPNYYKSETSFYPVGASLTKPVVEANDKELSYYGDDRDSDHLLSIAKASDLIDYIIGSQNLATHYKIDSSQKSARKKLHKKFKRNYSVYKSDHDAIILAVEDRSPEKARELVLAVRNYIEEKSRNIAKNSQKDLIESTERNVNLQVAKLDSLTNRIRDIRVEYGIYDTERQAEALATIEMRQAQDSRIQRKIKMYNLGISELKKLEIEQEELSKVLVYDSDLLNRLKRSHEMNTSMIHIIDEAQIPFEKSGPHRSLIVLAVALSSLFFGLLVVLGIEKMNQD